MIGELTTVSSVNKTLHREQQRSLLMSQESKPAAASIPLIKHIEQHVAPFIYDCIVPKCGPEVSPHFRASQFIIPQMLTTHRTHSQHLCLLAPRHQKIMMFQ
jgi:hypothetical protein